MSTQVNWKVQAHSANFSSEQLELLTSFEVQSAIFAGIQKELLFLFREKEIDVEGVIPFFSVYGPETFHLKD
jgi:hypothetical protein